MNGNIKPNDRTSIVYGSALQQRNMYLQSLAQPAYEGKYEFIHFKSILFLPDLRESLRYCPIIAFEKYVSPRFYFGVKEIERYICLAPSTLRSSRNRDINCSLHASCPCGGFEKHFK